MRLKLKQDSSTLLYEHMDTLGKTATAECNKLIGKAKELKDTVEHAESTRLSLKQAHNMANDMVSSLDGHRATNMETTSSQMDLIMMQLQELQDFRSSTEEANYIPLLALKNALSNATAQFASKSLVQAQSLRLDGLATAQLLHSGLANTTDSLHTRIDELEETVQQLLRNSVPFSSPPTPKRHVPLSSPPTPKRHEKFGAVDASTIFQKSDEATVHSSYHDFQPPPDNPVVPPRPSDADSLEDYIPYLSTVQIRQGSKLHYNCVILECIKRHTGLFYKVMNQVGSDFVVAEEFITNVDTTTSDRNHPQYINRSHSSPSRPRLPHGGRGFDRSRRPPPVPPTDRRPPSTYHNTDPYNDGDGDDDDDHFDHQNSYRPSARQLSRNEYEYPIGVRNCIREDKVSTILKGNFDPLTSAADTRVFYNKLRLEVAKYGIILIQYDEATPTESLLGFKPLECVNYEAAATTTARVLFDIFDQGKDILFAPDNHYHREIINTFKDSQDGLALLKTFISQHHVNFRLTQKHANLTQKYQIPQLRGKTIIGYIAAFKTWVSETNPMMTQRAIFQLVNEQLLLDTRYAKAHNDLSLHYSRYTAANASNVDPPHTLVNLAQTILEYYSVSEKNKLLQPMPATVNVVHAPLVHLDIKSMVKNFTRKDQKPSSFSGDKRPADKSLFCYGCCGYGHTVNDCTKTGAAILIEEFLAKLPAEKKSDLKKAYLTNRKLAHEKYLKSYKDRGKLRHQIKSLETTCFPTDADRRDPNQATIETFLTQRETAIRTARIHNIELDFGSLDTAYDDFLEPIFDFDPDTEEFDV